MNFAGPGTYATYVFQTRNSPWRLPTPKVPTVTLNNLISPIPKHALPLQPTASPSPKPLISVHVTATDTTSPCRRSDSTSLVPSALPLMPTDMVDDFVTIVEADGNSTSLSNKKHRVNGRRFWRRRCSLLRRLQSSKCFWHRKPR